MSTAGRVFGSTFCAAMTTLWLAGAAHAAPTIFSGQDPGANPPANSATVYLNSDAAAALFDSSNNETLFNLENLATGTATPLLIAPGISVSGSSADGNPQQILGAPTCGNVCGFNTTRLPALGSQYLQLFGGNVTFSFDTPIEDFGAYFTGVQLDGLTVTINYSDGTPQEVLPLPNPGSGVQFFGFLDAGKEISSIMINAQIGGTGDIIGIDDIRISTATAVPEPSSIVLLGVGLLGLGAIARRRSRRSSVTV